MRIVIGLTALMIAQAAHSAEPKAIAEMRTGTPTFTESSDKQARAIVTCVRKDASWSNAAQEASNHGTVLFLPARDPDTALDIAEEGDRRRISLWNKAQPTEGEAPPPSAMPAAGARLAAIKACI